MSDPIAPAEATLDALVRAVLAAIGRDALPAERALSRADAAAYVAAQVRLVVDDVTMARDAHFARAERAEARLAVAQAIILGGHHADDCPAQQHEECAYGGYDPDAALDDCDAGRTPAECAAARGACDCGVLRAVRAVECATPEALRDGAARAAEAAEATANRDRAWRYVHEARTERDAAIAHAAELEAALREARAGLDNAVATVARLREEIATERTARARAEAAMDERGLRLVAMVRERDALRAIVEGRTTPPTDEELDAHAVGSWACVTVGEWIFSDAGMDAEAARGLREVLAANAWAKPRWWPLDSAGRPCAWPTTEAPR